MSLPASKPPYDADGFYTCACRDREGRPYHREAVLHVHHGRVGMMELLPTTIPRHPFEGMTEEQRIRAGMSYVRNRWLPRWRAWRREAGS